MKKILKQTQPKLLAAVVAVLAAQPCLPVRCHAGNQPDFNGDGFADLAIGAPGEGVVFLGVNWPSAGAVNVIYGSAAATGGLNAVAPVLNQFWSQAYPGMPNVPAANDKFGSTLAWGDFNGDGFSDLAIGVPGDNAGFGAVDVIYGSPNGLNAAAAPVLPVQHLNFGSVVASGDFDGDGMDDLAIGAPHQNAGGAVDAGAVFEFRGAAGGLAYIQQWDQGVGTIIGICENYDYFGAALTTGDFNHDGYADLAVGVPYEDVEAGGVVTANDAGAVNVILGSAAGLTATGNQWWWQDSAGITGICENYDYFGFSLAAGDFNHDGYDDLAVGSPNEDVEVGGVVTIANAGAVNVIPGSAAGLTATGSQWWWQDSTGILDACEAEDHFGHSVAAGDFNGDGYADLAIGAPGEDIVRAGVNYVDAGAAHVFYGSAAGLTAAGNQFWHQDSGGILDVVEANDRFGWSLAAADFNGDGKDDLNVGVMSEDIVRAGVNYVDAGAANVLYGAAAAGAGLTATGNQFWNQDSPNIVDTVEPYDFFGGCAYGP